MHFTGSNSDQKLQINGKAQIVVVGAFHLKINTFMKLVVGTP